MKNKIILVLLAFYTASYGQQFLGQTVGVPVPPEVEKMYKAGLNYLVTNQQPDGTWGGDYYSLQPGVVGLAILAILAYGEDPNFGPYSTTVKRSVSYILKQQHSGTGMIGSSMYNHGFATLALAEVYGTLNNDKIGPALEKAVKLLLSSQARNPQNSWRYSPSGKDADTTAAGACMVALFAAQNAGVGVPKSALEKGMEYYKKCQSSDGGFGYTGPGGSNAPRTAIGTLVYALGKKKNSKVWEKSLGYLKRTGYVSNQYYHYYVYYMSQALFQSDTSAWRKWNKINTQALQVRQGTNGAWVGNHGVVFSTSGALLSMALNYRFLPIYER